MGSFKTYLPLVWKFPQEYSTHLFLLVWIITVFFFFSIPQSKIITYILPLFPSVALLTSCYLSSCFDLCSQSKRMTYLIGYSLLSMITACLFFLIFTHHLFLEVSTDFLLYLKIMGIILLLGLFTSLVFIKQRSLISLVIICLITNILLLISLTYGAKYLNVNSVKQLALKVKLLKNIHDPVVSYYHYYQDLPLYLNETVTIVADWKAEGILNQDNWRREFIYGQYFQSIKPILIDEDFFWKQFNGDKHIFVLLDQRSLNDFDSHAKAYFYLGKENDVVLVSNQPPS